MPEKIEMIHYGEDGIPTENRVFALEKGVVKKKLFSQFETNVKLENAMAKLRQIAGRI